MSVLPIFRASFVGLILVGLFTWNVWLLLIVLVCLMSAILIYLYDNIGASMLHYESAFWLFIFSEVAVFGTLLFCCLYFDSWAYMKLSRALELPFVGCFVLLGSSITVTGFHHLLGWDWSRILLFFTVVLGFSFVALQICEMEEIAMNIYDTSFHASRFCTVGLHFIHVVIGVVGLSVILLVGDALMGFYRCSVMTWYWHFVDYVWLFVYTFVYVCYYW